MDALTFPPPAPMPGFPPELPLMELAFAPEPALRFSEIFLGLVPSMEAFEALAEAGQARLEKVPPEDPSSEDPPVEDPTREEEKPPLPVAVSARPEHPHRWTLLTGGGADPKRLPQSQRAAAPERSSRLAASWQPARHGEKASAPRRVDPLAFALRLWEAAPISDGRSAVPAEAAAAPLQPDRAPSAVRIEKAAEPSLASRRREGAPRQETPRMESSVQTLTGCDAAVSQAEVSDGATPSGGYAGQADGAGLGLPETPEPAGPEKPAAEAPPKDVRELSLRVGPRQSEVDVRVREQAGRLYVAVRTPDQALAGSLAGELDELVGRMEQEGFQAERWTLADPTPSSFREPGGEGRRSRQGRPGWSERPVRSLRRRNDH